MSLDEKLLKIQESSDGPVTENDNQKASSSGDRAGSLNQARQNSRRNDSENYQRDPNAGSLRERVLARKRAQGGADKSDSEEAVSGSFGLGKGASQLLQKAWLNLITSFGLTLIWINIHAFLNILFGDKVFCKLGKEWGGLGVPGVSPVPGLSKGQTKIKKFAETGEPAALACCDLGCLFLIIIMAVIGRIIVGILIVDWEALKVMLSGVWEIFSGFIGL